MWTMSYTKILAMTIIGEVLSPVSAASSPCPPGCSTCEALPSTSYVIRAFCSGVPPSALPPSVRELKVTKVNFHGALQLDSFENKTELTLLELTNSTGCSIIFDEAFKVCSKLNNLIIENTDLINLGEKSFWGLVSLETLSLKHNKLMAINKAFLTLKKLTHLDLDSNQLFEITSDSFQGLTELYDLHIVGNKISTIAKDAFKDLIKLDSLYLGQNRLTKLDSGLFKGLGNLKKLDLKFNKISEIEQGAFTGTALVLLDLTSNKFTDFPSESFRNLSHTPQRMSLSENSITKLENFAFQGLTCQLLDLRNNKISVIENNAFSNCSLQMVQLDENKLSTFPAEVQSFWEKARAITIDGNSWKCTCDLLWMVKFIINSSPRKYKARATSPMPSCDKSNKYANKLFSAVEPLLEAECITTTTSVVVSTTTVSTTVTEHSTTKVSSTTQTTPTTTDTTTATLSSSTTVTSSTVSPTTESTITTTTPVSTTAKPVSKENQLFPGLWIGLAVLAALLIAGVIFWLGFGKGKFRKAQKIDPDDGKNPIPPLLAPTVIQVQAPSSTAMPKIVNRKISQNMTQNVNGVELHNRRTLESTSIA